MLAHKAEDEGIHSLSLLSPECYYLCCHLVSGEGIVSLGVRLCVCPPSHDCMPH